MKKLLFLLLLIPMLAKAQFPAPTGLTPFGSAVFLYKIVGSDTLVYAKSSNGLYFPIGRGSGTSGAFLPLTFRSDNQVRIGSHNFLMTSDSIGGQFYLFQHGDAGMILESSTNHWSSGFSVLGYRSSLGVRRVGSLNTIGFTVDTTGSFYSDKVNKILPHADSLYRQVSRNDFALWGNVIDTINAHGTTGANPTASIGFTAVNGSAATFTRSDGAPKADSTVIRSVANSYSLATMQTKLNNYALTSALPVGANPTATAGTSAVNGSATTFMRSDGAPKVDSTAFRTVANSKTLAQEQTALNLKANLASPTFTGTVTIPNGSVLGTPTSMTATNVTGLPLTTGVIGILPVANGGTGTATPGIVAGTNVTVTGTWPNQTVNSTAATSLTAGRGILLPSTAIILDTTQNYTWLKAQTVTKNGIATTSTNALNILNTTASTSGVKDQYSPSLHFGAQVWNGSQNDWTDWQLSVKTINGASPVTYLAISKSLTATSTPSYVDAVTIDNSSNLATQGNISTAAGKSMTTSSFFASTAQITTSIQTPLILTGTSNALFLQSATAISSAVNVVNIHPNSIGGAITNSSGQANILDIAGTYNSTSTAAGTGISLNETISGTGSGAQYLADFQKNSVSQWHVDLNGQMYSQSLTASKVLFTDASKNITSTGIGTATQLIAGDGSLVTGSITQGSADLTAQSAAGNIATFTVGASTATFNISSYLNITAIATDVIKTQVTYTDENSTAQTVDFYTQGATLSNLSATGNSQYPPMTIRAKNATTITVKTTLTTSGGSITFDAGARITQL